MSVPFFSICKACRKYKTWASTMGEKEEEGKKKNKNAGKLILHNLGKGQSKVLSVCHAQSSLCFKRVEWEKAFTQSFPIYAISPHSPSPPWT